MNQYLLSFPYIYDLKQNVTLYDIRDVNTYGFFFTYLKIIHSFLITILTCFTEASTEPWFTVTYVVLC